MTTKMKKAVSLINRIQFIDLSLAIAQSSSNRKDWLRNYLNRKQGKFLTYEPFRKATPTIYGVSRPLDLSPPVSRADLERSLRAACNPDDADMNVSAALTLFDLARSQIYSAYDHDPRSLRLGLDKYAAIRIDQYLVKDDEAIFQFPYPRRNRLDNRVLKLMMSMIHYAYVVGDFSEARVEIADLSCEDAYLVSAGERLPSVRAPRILRMTADDLVPRELMEPEIQTVHDLLMEIGHEPDI